MLGVIPTSSETLFIYNPPLLLTPKVMYLMLILKQRVLLLFLFSGKEINEDQPKENGKGYLF